MDHEVVDHDGVDRDEVVVHDDDDDDHCFLLDSSRHIKLHIDMSYKLLNNIVRQNYFPSQDFYLLAVLDCSFVVEAVGLGSFAVGNLEMDSSEDKLVVEEYMKVVVQHNLQADLDMVQDQFLVVRVVVVMKDRT